MLNKRRRAKVPLFHQNRNISICQKDPIKRASSGYYSYQYDVGDQLDDVANSSEGDEELQFKIGNMIRSIIRRPLYYDNILQKHCCWACARIIWTWIKLRICHSHLRTCDFQGIPGFRTIFGKGNHPLRRIFWILLTIVCSFLAFYQVCSRSTFFSFLYLYTHRFCLFLLLF